MNSFISIQNYYLETLCYKNFVFQTEVGQLVLKFTEANFAHLIGLHHFDEKLKGNYAWDKIRNEEIDIKMIKKLNQTKFKTILLPRIETMYKINNIFIHSKVVKKFKQTTSNAFNCDLVFYNKEEKVYYVVTFFIDKSTKLYCSAASFLKFHQGDLNVMKYINPNNPEIAIYSFQVTKEEAYNDIDYSKYYGLK